MQPFIIYNGRKYRKHKKQPYYYCSESKGIYSRSLHRQMWFDANGEVPKGYQVHHINHDSTDNRIENLSIVERVAHIKMHMAKRVKENPELFKRIAEIGRPFAAKWHGSKEGRKWHRQHAKNFSFGNFEYGQRNCDACNKEFTAVYALQRFCSNNCKSSWRRSTGIDNETRKCAYCKKPFIIDKYKKAILCSRTCSGAYRKQNNQLRKNRGA